MPSHCVNRLARSLGGLTGKTVAIMGLAYRGGVKEIAFSGAFPLADAIVEAGGIAVVHDPLFTADEMTELHLTKYEIGAVCDAAIVQADHREYATLSPADLPGIKALLDGRHITDPGVWRKAGVIHMQVGISD